MKNTCTAEIMKVTPEMAAEWLSNRWGEQRGLRSGYVNRLASDMEAGRFRVSPDAILRVKGKLANGQHRLSAVLQTGKSQQFIVLDSTDEDLYKVIDAGMKRRVSDGLIGLSYSHLIPAISRWVRAYDSGVFRQSAKGGASAGKNAQREVPTHSEMIEYCQEHAEILSEAAGFTNRLYEQTKLLPTSLGGAIYVLASRREGMLDKAQDFLEQVYIGGGKSSASELRNRLISNRGSKARLAAGYIFGLTIKSFKAFCDGNRICILKWSKDEGYPTLWEALP